MASLITHALIGIVQGAAGERDWRKSRMFWLAAILCSMLPDIDVIGFNLGVRYGDLWGHRGMTHSLLSAAIIGLAAGFSQPWREKWKLAFLFFVITASHGVVDALTNGALASLSFHLSILTATSSRGGRSKFPLSACRRSSLSAEYT